MYEFALGCGNVHLSVNKTEGIENQYKIKIFICNFVQSTLSDDYSCVLRKLQTQMSATNLRTYSYCSVVILLVESFTSKYTSKEQLITIFKQHNIRVILTNELFETSNCIEIESANINKLIEENKIITENLLQTQQKLLQAEEKMKYLEDAILKV